MWNNHQFFGGNCAIIMEELRIPSDFFFDDVKENIYACAFTLFQR